MSEQTISEFIRQLDLAGKSISMYSENHPSAKGALDQAFALLQEPLHVRPAVTLSIIGSDILVDGEPVRRGDRAIERFIKTLDTRNVRSLTFGSAVTRDELVQTLRLLNYTPQRIRELGGMELLLEKEGVSGVQANKVRYGIIGDSGQGGTSTVPMTVDESLIAQLMNTVQVGQADFGAAAQSVEGSLEDTGSPDSSAVLFRIFQNMAQGSVEPQKPLRERFLEMFRSFTPKMQGKLLLTAVLNRALLEKSSLSGFYYELKPEELESPITAVLMLEQATDQELQGFTDALMQDEKLLLPDSVRQKMTQRGLLKPQEVQPPPSEDLRKKAVLDAGDYPRLLYFIRQEIDAGNLEEADKLLKKLLGGMTSPQADQRAAAVRMLPLLVQELSSHEKWKNVETSISFLVANHFRKESEAAVIEAYAEYLGAGFRKKFESNDFAGCKEYLSLLAGKPEAKAAIADGLALPLPEMRDSFQRELKETGPNTEMILEFLRRAGEEGADFLLEWLAEEEDQRVRSRIIGYTERLDQECLLPVMEKRLADPRWYVVRNMVTISGRLNLPNSVPFMSQAMQDPDIRVAKEVVKALFKSVTASNAPLVLHLLQHDDKSIRLQALRLVTLFGLEKGDARVTLQKMAATDSVPEVRTLASSILG